MPEPPHLEPKDPQRVVDPLSTLRRRPCEQLRMTRGRCGSLLHIRMTFAFTTPRRFNRRTGEEEMRTKSMAGVLIALLLTAGGPGGSGQQMSHGGKDRALHNM